MHTFGARLGHVEEGLVEIEAPYQEHLTQQDGFLHAGIVTALIDSACGYAAYTMMPPGHRVLSVEFKVNLLLPSKGERFLARGKVVKSGRTLTICTGELIAYQGQTAQTVAIMQATMMSLAPTKTP
ncbi:MAG: PaaI family thioesterase [Myxococcales bacterium]|nr:PaaI family thioesterase [Myxococcales bacterium]